MADPTMAGRPTPLAHIHLVYSSLNEARSPTFPAAGVKRALWNDALGTVDSAESTGSDEKKETGNANKENTKTLED
jgi:hypothetical protein